MMVSDSGGLLRFLFPFPLSKILPRLCLVPDWYVLLGNTPQIMLGTRLVCIIRAVGFITRGAAISYKEAREKC